MVQTRQAELVGSLVTNEGEIHNRLKQFKAALLADHAGILPRLYFVKVDVKACFDTINQQTLLEILDRAVGEVSGAEQLTHVSLCRPQADCVPVTNRSRIRSNAELRLLQLRRTLTSDSDDKQQGQARPSLGRNPLPSSIMASSATKSSPP